MNGIIININYLIFLFVGFVPSYRCRVPKCEDVSSSYGYLDSNGSLVLPSFYADEKKIEKQCKIPEITYEWVFKSNKTTLWEENRNVYLTHFLQYSKIFQWWGWMWGWRESFQFYDQQQEWILWTWHTNLWQIHCFKQFSWRLWICLWIVRLKEMEVGYCRQHYF